MRSAAALFVAFTCLLATPVSARANDRTLAGAQGPSGAVLAVIVEGATNADHDTVRWIAGLAKGGTFSPEMRPQIIARLTGSKMFREGVDVTWERRPGGYIVTLLVRDRYSFRIALGYHNQPIDKGASFGFVKGDLFGARQRLVLRGQLATGASFLRGAFIAPTIADSAFGWRIETSLGRERIIEYRPPLQLADSPEEIRHTRLIYLNLRAAATFVPASHWSAQMGIRGARVAYADTELALDAHPSDLTGDPTTRTGAVADPGRTGYELAGGLRVTYDDRASFYGVTCGQRYDLNLEYAPDWRVFDFGYWWGSFDLHLARPVLGRHNVAVRARAAYGHNLPFQREFTSGGVDLRGYKNRQYRGNLQFGATVSYSVPVIAPRGVSVRALAFADTAYTGFTERAAGDVRAYLPGAGALGLAPWKNTVGLGVRLHARQFVEPFLAVDFGYGLERQAAEVYLSLGLTGQ